MEFNQSTNSKFISNLINDMGYEGYGIFLMLNNLMPVYGYSIPCCYHALGIRMSVDPDKIKRVVEEYYLFQVGAEYYGSETIVIQPAPGCPVYEDYIKRQDELFKIQNEQYELEKLENQIVKQYSKGKK